MQILIASMGMTRNQVLRMIQLPLSVSVIIGGIRIALVVAIGVVAVGSFIGLAGDIVVIGDRDLNDGTTFILAVRSDCYHCNRH